MTAFTAWDWACILLAWLLLAAVCAPLMGRGIAIAEDREIRQPDYRNWAGSDGRFRTETEALAWCAATPGAAVWRIDEPDAEWLDAWTFGETVPDSIPQEWTA